MRIHFSPQSQLILSHKHFQMCSCRLQKLFFSFLQFLRPPQTLPQCNVENLVLYFSGCFKKGNNKLTWGMGVPHRQYPYKYSRRGLHFHSFKAAFFSLPIPTLNSSTFQSSLLTIKLAFSVTHSHTNHMHACTHMQCGRVERAHTVVLKTLLFEQPRDSWVMHKSA